MHEQDHINYVRKRSSELFDEVREDTFETIVSVVPAMAHVSSLINKARHTYQTAQESGI